MEAHNLIRMPFCWDNYLEVSDKPEHLFQLDHLEEIEHIRLSGMRVKISYDPVLGRFSLSAVAIDGTERSLNYRAYPEG